MRLLLRDGTAVFGLSIEWARQDSNLDLTDYESAKSRKLWLTRAKSGPPAPGRSGSNRLLGNSPGTRRPGTYRLDRPQAGAASRAPRIGGVTTFAGLSLCSTEAGARYAASRLSRRCESGAAASEAPASRAQRGSGRAGVAGSAPSRREWAARMLCRFCGRARLWSGCFYLARRTRAARPRLGRGASCLADERARRKRARSVADAAPNVRRSAGPSDAIVSSTGMPAMCASGITGRSPWCSRRLGGAPRGRGRGRWGGCGSRRRSRGRPASHRRASS